jgi:hypothetical protein
VHLPTAAATPTTLLAAVRCLLRRPWSRVKLHSRHLDIPEEENIKEARKRKEFVLNCDTFGLNCVGLG